MASGPWVDGAWSVVGGQIINDRVNGMLPGREAEMVNWSECYHLGRKLQVVQGKKNSSGKRMFSIVFLRFPDMFKGTQLLRLAMTRALGDHMLKMPARVPIRKVWMREPDFGVSFRVSGHVF